MDAEILLIYFDGACEPRNPGGWATFGWVAKRNGATVATGKGCAGYGDGMTNQVAEYAALLAALRWLADTDQQGAVEIRGDSQLVVRQMTGEWRCYAEHLQPLHREALELACQFTGPVLFRWVPRGENAEADELSKEAYEEARAQAGESDDGYTGRGDPAALPIVLAVGSQ